LPKGVVAWRNITWNGHPSANSFKSSAVPGVPPFSNYSNGLARANTTVASLLGPTINLGAQGVVSGNVMTGPGVTVTNGTITGQQIQNFSYSFTMPDYPVNAGATAGVNLASTIPATLPRAADVTARDAEIVAGTKTASDPFYYYVTNTTIGAVNITAGKNVVIRGSSNTRMTGGLMVLTSGSQVGSAKIYIDGAVDIGNSAVNTTSWAGALEVYTSTSSRINVSGNGAFYGCLFAPNAELKSNGGGNDSIDLCGSFVVNSITTNGHMKFHYDEGLGSTSNPRPWGLALWTELHDAEDRAFYASKFNF
jgi:hypothetical protein